jgi:integrase
MARRVRDRNLESREARRNLKVSGRPYWRAIDRGLHLGYRKGKTGGVWVARRYIGHQSYHIERLAQADDLRDADGDIILDFWQAQQLARSARAKPRKSDSAYTVKDAVAEYLDSLIGRATHNDVTKRMQAFVLPVFADKAVADLEADELRNWHRSLTTTPARCRTAHGATQAYRTDDLSDPEIARKRQVSANQCLTYFKAALNHAWRAGKATSPDAWQRVKLFRGVDVPRARWLSFAEAQRLINAAQGDFRILVRAALETGARYSELARMRVTDFNVEVGTLHVRTSKSGKDRHIQLTEDGREFFASLASGRPGSALILGRAWGTSHQDWHMKEACKRAGIKPAINFHALRHTWASLSIMAGLPMFVVAKNLGHSDTRMVEKHYGHLCPSYVATEIRARAPRFGKVASNVVAVR